MYGYQVKVFDQKMPHTCGVHYLQAVFVDPKWMANPKNTPDWWWLNHSGTPNAKLRIVGNREMRCIALAPIPKGAEIFFDYLEPDEAWNKP